MLRYCSSFLRQSSVLVHSRAQASLFGSASQEMAMQKPPADSQHRGRLVCPSAALPPQDCSSLGKVTSCTEYSPEAQVPTSESQVTTCKVWQDLCVQTDKGYGLGSAGYLQRLRSALHISTSTPSKRISRSPVPPDPPAAAQHRPCTNAPGHVQ